MDANDLKMALVGYELERQKLEVKIAEIQRQLGGRRGAAPVGAKPPTKRRRLSTAARKRIVEAQKKRWAEYRAKKKAK